MPATVEGLESRWLLAATAAPSRPWPSVTPAANGPVSSHHLSPAITVIFNPGGGGNILPVATSVTLTASASTIQETQFVDVTATLSGTESALPTGTVAFYVNRSPVQTVPVSNGTAAFDTNALPAGPDTISAIYRDSGYDHANASSASIVITVVPIAVPSTVTASASAARAGLGEPVSLTATVGPAASTIGVIDTLGIVPTGTVDFSAGGSDLGTATIGADGVATLTTTALRAGTDVITATYGGDATFESDTSTRRTSPKVIVTAPLIVVPTVVSSTLPTTAVAGETLRGVITLELTNGTSAAERGGIEMTVALVPAGASTATATLVAKRVAVALRPGGSAKATLRVRSVLSKTLASGIYDVLVSSAGFGDLVANAGTVTISAAQDKRPGSR